MSLFKTTSWELYLSKRYNEYRNKMFKIEEDYMFLLLRNNKFDELEKVIINSINIVLYVKYESYTIYEYHSDYGTRLNTDTNDIDTKIIIPKILINYNFIKLLINKIGIKSIYKKYFTQNYLYYLINNKKIKELELFKEHINIEHIIYIVNNNIKELNNILSKIKVKEIFRLYKNYNDDELKKFMNNFIDFVLE